MYRWKGLACFALYPTQGLSHTGIETSWRPPSTSGHWAAGEGFLEDGEIGCKGCCTKTSLGLFWLLEHCCICLYSAWKCTPNQNCMQNTSTCSNVPFQSSCISTSQLLLWRRTLSGFNWSASLWRVFADKSASFKLWLSASSQSNHKDVFQAALCVQPTSTNDSQQPPEASDWPVRGYSFPQWLMAPKGGNQLHCDWCLTRVYTFVIVLNIVNI